MHLHIQYSIKLIECCIYFFDVLFFYTIKKMNDGEVDNFFRILLNISYETIVVIPIKLHLTYLYRHFYSFSFPFDCESNKKQYQVSVFVEILCHINVFRTNINYLRDLLTAKSFHKLHNVNQCIDSWLSEIKIWIMMNHGDSVTLMLLPFQCTYLTRSRLFL